jgi:RNA polymerase sigma-70 factor (ECF subfamily)
MGMYFTNYERAGVTLRLASLEGQLVFAAYDEGALQPGYFIVLEFEEGRVSFIRDFRYVPYITAEAEFHLVTD